MDPRQVYAPAAGPIRLPYVINFPKTDGGGSGSAPSGQALVPAERRSVQASTTRAAMPFSASFDHARGS